MKLPITLVVITLNEQRVIGRCLQSAEPIVSEMIVVDSLSGDATVDIATTHGARVIQHEWLGYGAQRQLGVSAASFDWILVLDADEVVSEDLARSIRNLFSPTVPPANSAFGVDRPKDFMGVVMPSPARRANAEREIRLFNRTTASYDTEAKVHERVLFDGRPELLAGPLLHLQGLTLGDELVKMNLYSGLEADEAARMGLRPSLVRLIVKPVARFLWTYIARRYYRHGAKGFIHSTFRAFWEFFTEAKRIERALTKP
jgi:glycosyltransferase involved in cell wall biosynthesis